MKDISRKLTVVNTDTRKPVTGPSANENVGGGGTGISFGGISIGGGLDYLLKAIWDKVWEIKTDSQGNEYIFGKLPVVTQYGITMYADGGDLNLPSIYAGIPFDNKTIWLNPETKKVEVIEGTGGEGGGGLTEVYWDDIKLKPTFASVATSGSYSDLSGLPDLSVYATTEYLTAELKKYVTRKTEQTIDAHKDFLDGLSIGGLPITKSQEDVIYLDANLVVRGGITMYAEGTVNIPSIIESIHTATNHRKGLASFDAEFFTVDAAGHVTLIPENVGLNEEELSIYLTENKYATQDWITSKSYAKNDDLLFLKARIDDFLEGSDTDTIINKWKELESFLSGLSESDNLATILGTKANQSDLDDTNDVVATKWTQDDIKIGNWDTAYKWGDHSKAGYALKSYVDDTFVTIATKQPITGEKNFTGGLKVNGSPIVYDATNKYWKLEGDLLVTGGVTMYASDSAFTPSTIMDGVVVDGVTIGKRASDGALYFMGETGGGLTEVYWDDVKRKPTFALVATSGKYADLSGTPTLLSSFINDKGYIDQDGVFNTDPLKSGKGGVGVVAGGCMTIPAGENFSDYISKKKSFIGSILNTDNVWYNTISLRHCNGADDGVGYGMVIYCVMNIAYQQELYYNTQVNGSWQDARVILDSHNWSRFIKAGDGGNYLPLSGGEINGSLQISNGSLALLGAKNSGASTISFESNGNSYSAITVSRYGIDYNGVLSILPKGGMVGVGLTNPEYKFHVQGDIYSSGMVMTNNGVDSRGASSYGSLPYIRLHIPGLTYAQFLLNSNGVVELRYGDNTQTGRFVDFYSGNIVSSGGITMYSDIRKKTKLQDVELTLKQIANAPLIEHYYNSDTNKTTHVGSIAQYWASMNDWFCKLDGEGFYTMEIQNAALASAISIARELVKYESKTDRKIRLLKKRVKELEDKIEQLENR